MTHDEGFRRLVMALDARVSLEEAQKHPAWKKLEQAERDLKKISDKLNVYNRHGNYRKLAPAAQAEWDKAYNEYNDLRNKVHKETGYA